MKIGTLDPALLGTHIEQRIGEDLQAQRISGAAVAVLQHGKVLYKAAFGTRAPETSQPLAADALFRIASMTKPVTAVAVLIQAQRGKLDPEDPVARYLPAYGRLFLESGEVCPVPLRIRHLLTHTGGMEAHADAKERFRAIPAEQNRILADAVEYYARLPLAFVPGTKRRYSGRAAFDILGRIVEITAGMDFATFVQREIFAPCGMTDTTFAPTEAQWARLVGMHDYRDGCAVTAQTTPGCVVDAVPVTHPMGGSGLVSSLDDYVKFAEMLRNRGMTPTGRILPPAAVDRMARPHLDPSLMSVDVNQGLGVRVITGEGYPWLPVGTYGWSGAYGTHFWVDPVNEITAVYMKNSRYDGGSGAVTARHFEEDVFRSIR
jgi:CubicO group peptidase (beta-lactamase class C family)